MRMSNHFFAKWEILGVVAGAALLSRRADRLTALTLATTVVVSWGRRAPSDGWRYCEPELHNTYYVTYVSGAHDSDLLDL